ncbi:probable rhamnogalacturonate lyase B isoform X2 [Mangifera indica]|uniref:probable rhamnogalacturonate lyase B isoform X2 n=1 Tax=Mangifera indica TaxID=29780 RepID=UPI001CF9C595|nr:probable rhamnogalacturonate lyase B isoform X2 [Mangifera indica]
MKMARARLQPQPQPHPHPRPLSFSLLFLLVVSSQAVRLQIQDKYVVMDNEILQVTISNPQGIVTGIKFRGMDNLLEVRNPEIDRGYWDLVWSEEGTKGTKGVLDRIEATNFTVVVEREEQVELSFSRIWNSSLEGQVVPLNIDKRFIMLRGSSGFYTYAIFEHLDDWPPFNIDNIRMAFKLNQDNFHYMAIADDRQRFMPLPEDRLPERGQELAYPEAVLLVNPVEPEFKGEVDDKYEYSCRSQDIWVHGWISNNPSVGFWQISPSMESRSAGPLKQFLTSHVGPTTLALFHSVHYSGEDLVLRFKKGEPWKKVFGPIFIYVNSFLEGDDPLQLWKDAKQQMMNQVQNWPYDFPASEDFPKFEQRGSVSGRLLVQDRCASHESKPAYGAHVGLALPGEAGSWQRECKGYQFWTRADENGNFSINNIRTGNYSLYATVPGFIGDYRYDANITITENCNIELGDLVYEPPRDGPTLWEIGIPDRSAAEFFVPDPNPKYINKLYVNHSDRYRQYGLWERYAELYPDGDLTYTVDHSNYSKDWFFAQVTRKKDNVTYEATTWQIIFKLDNVNTSATYKLRLALASAHASNLQVRINDPLLKPALFSTGIIGKENTIARHGIYGLYWLFNVDLPGAQLLQGNNTILLTQTQSTTAFQGIMYDYIRLEGPPDF